MWISGNMFCYFYIAFRFHSELHTNGRSLRKYGGLENGNWHLLESTKRQTYNIRACLPLAVKVLL